MITTKSEAFKELLNHFSDALSSNGCNDFKVANNTEMYALLEQQAADNLSCKSIEEFRAHPEYEDYKPNISADKKYIYTSDYVILAIIRKDLGAV
jgi:hypothetical protein